jgi:amino acid adenylation domain-containing protein
MARSVGSCLAQVLPMRGVVAVLMNGRNIDCIPAFLGVIYAGGAYAPLDPSMPQERMELILSIMKPDCILADDYGRAALSLPGNQHTQVIGYANAAHTAIDQSVLDKIRVWSSMFDPLSILYTSGSTGIPKGSVQSHSSYIHYNEETIDVFGFDENVVFGSQSPFFYANSIIDIYPPIALGAQVYLLPANALAFPARFLSCLKEHHVTELTMTPSSFVAIANSEVFQPGCLTELSYGIMSGERMPWRPLMQWMKAAPNAGFYNFYGSTEAFSVAVGKVEGDHDEGELLPVGKPYRHAHIVFIDEDECETDPLTGGEMLISNPWLSAGYHRNAERTQAAFLIDPMRRGYFERFYRTGDIGRLNENGELLVLGRRDSQIKHHGYRMELGEVENALRSISGWADGCVLFNNESGQIYCFWTGKLTQIELQTALKSKLQRYMLPDFYVHLESMPHTATMKIDRVSLFKAYMEQMN